MTKTILITGGCGFIGSNFIRFLLDRRTDWQIINLDCLSYSGSLENLADLEDHPNYRFTRGNILDRPVVESLLALSDAVVHLAAESHVDRSILDARAFLETNVLGTQTLLQAARTVWKTGNGYRGRFLHVSTDEVYGSLPLDRTDQLFTEQTPIETSSPYAASKAAGDLIVKAYGKTYGLDVLVTRCSNNFGPYQFPEKIIPLFVTNLIEGEQVPLYGDGLNVRDWLYVTDHCEALLTVLEKGVTGEVYNVGGNNEQSNLELTHTILRLMGKDGSMIRYVQDRPGHDRRYAIDATKIARDLGWRPTRSEWPDALERTIRWYQTHENWWRGVKSGEYLRYYERQYANRS